MREVHSPSPQPEDPDRALDPGLKEDPDTFVQLVDWTFYLLSYDGGLVAIIADYPGLLPVSQVSKTGVPTSKKESGEPAGHASTSRTPRPDLRAEVNTDDPPTEDADGFSMYNPQAG